MSRIVPDVIDSYMEYVSAYGGSMPAHLWSVVTTLSAVLERRVWVKKGDDLWLFPNIYTAIVGTSGSGKSTAIELATSLTDRLTAQGTFYKIANELSHAAFIEKLSKCMKEVRIHGNGPLKYSSAFAVATELGTILTDIGGGDVYNLLISFFDGVAGNPNDKLYVKETRSFETETVVNGSVSLLGGTTPEFIRTQATEILTGGGLASRIIFVNIPDLGYTHKPFVQGVNMHLRACLQDTLNHIFKLTGECVPQPAVVEYLNTEVVSYVEGQKRRFEDNSYMQGYLSRRGDLLIKLGMIASLSHSDKLTMSIRDIRRAEGWLAEIEPSLVKSFGIKNISNDASLPDQLLKKVPANRFVSKSDMCRLFMDGNKLLSMNGQVDEILTALVTSGRLERRSENGAISYKKAT